jgi:hypothetical protein
VLLELDLGEVLRVEEGGREVIGGSNKLSSERPISSKARN